MVLHYSVSQVRLYINWLYFYHAWDLSGKPESAKKKLRGEADRLLDQWEARYRTHTVFRILDANSDGDDLLIDNVRVPLLRQQHPTHPGEPNLCLADFVRPKSSGIADKVGIFASTVDQAMEHEGRDDVYHHLLAQTLADRLAEATTECMHLEVRRHYWGYAPDENLSVRELHSEKFQGIRPAIGYPSLPDTSVNFILDQLLEMGQIGIRLTRSGMMMPHASVSGFMFAHPQAHYFDLGHIGEDQLVDYAKRRGLPVDLVRHFLQSSLLKK